MFISHIYYPERDTLIKLMGDLDPDDDPVEYAWEEYRKSNPHDIKAFLEGVRLGKESLLEKSERIKKELVLHKSIVSKCNKIAPDNLDATLFETIGETPQEDWKLFNNRVYHLIGNGGANGGDTKPLQIFRADTTWNHIFNKLEHAYKRITSQLEKVTLSLEALEFKQQILENILWQHTAFGAVYPWGSTKDGQTRKIGDISGETELGYLCAMQKLLEEKGADQFKDTKALLRAAFEFHESFSDPKYSFEDQYEEDHQREKFYERALRQITRTLKDNHLRLPQETSEWKEFLEKFIDCNGH